jgi:hypothetical protein
METPNLIMPGGNDDPLWGHCSACDAKFSPRNKQAQRNEQEDDMHTQFLQHLGTIHISKVPFDGDIHEF